MFQSYNHILSDNYLIPDTFEIIDSNFTSRVKVDRNMLGLWMAVYKVYSRRKLNVGVNIALATIYLSNNSKYSIEELTDHQDKHCIKHIKNWNKIANKRDKYLLWA